MMITIERVHYLYTLLTETSINYGSVVTSINYGSVVTSTIMSVRLLDKGFALPYGALITRIAERFRVDMIGLREVQPEKGAMGVCFLNASQAHLREAKQEPRA
jgi:hypothetical protein